MNKPILMIDASTLKESSCNLRTYYSLIQGYRSKLSTNDVMYGSAIHEFIKVAKENRGNLNPALIEAKKIFHKPCLQKSNKKWMTEQHLIKDCMDYWDSKGDPRDEWNTVWQGDKPLVELKFALPYRSTPDYDILLAGTVDDICQRGNNGMYAIRDYKTTSVYNAEDYLHGYRIDPQLKFYYFIIQNYAERYPNSIFPEMLRKGLGVFIRGIFLNSKLDAEANIMDSEVFMYKQDTMNIFKRMLDKKIDDIISMLTTVPLPEGTLNGACKTVYGPCKYHNVCGAVDSFSADYVLKANFIQQAYDPLNFNE